MDQHKKAIALAFNRAAKTYDQHADFQRRLGHYLLDKHKDNIHGHILDLGCGTGYFSALLYQKAQEMTCLDLSGEMLLETRLRLKNRKEISFLQGDADHLDFSPRFHCVFSNLALQWSQDLHLPLKGLKNATLENGHIFISTLVNGSLCELDTAWKMVDKRSHINRFMDVNEIQKCIEESGFSDYSIEVKPFKLEYSKAILLLKDLKGIGATYQPERKSKGLTTKDQLEALERAYRKITGSGKLTATYQCCIMHLRV